MSGAWEVSNPLLMIATPNTDIVTVNWSMAYAAMWKPQNVLLQGWSGMPIDVARNVFVKNAREKKVKYLLYLDSDVLPVNQNWIKMLLDVQQPIISGLYYSKKGHPGMWVKTPGDPPERQTYTAITEYPTNSMVTVDAIGAGALLVDMRVFDVIDKVIGRQNDPAHPDLGQYFKWDWPDPENVLPGEKSEDFYFCHLAQRAGFSILVHTGVELTHEQTVSWSPKGAITRFHS